MNDVASIALLAIAMLVGAALYSCLSPHLSNTGLVVLYAVFAASWVVLITVVAWLCEV